MGGSSSAHSGIVWVYLTINLAKCEFAKAKVSHLGKVVGQGKVHPVRAKVLEVDQFPVPTSKVWWGTMVGLSFSS